MSPLSDLENPLELSFLINLSIDFLNYLERKSHPSHTRSDPYPQNCAIFNTKKYVYFF